MAYKKPNEVLWRCGGCDQPTSDFQDHSGCRVRSQGSGYEPAKAPVTSLCPVCGQPYHPSSTERGDLYGEKTEKTPETPVLG